MLDRSCGLLSELSLWLNAGAIKGLILIAASFIRLVPMHGEGGAWRKGPPPGSAYSAKQHCQKDTPVLFAEVLTHARQIRTPPLLPGLGGGNT